MRGLETRAEFARAKVLSITSPAEGENLWYAAVNDANVQGYQDYEDNIHDAPKMFSDEPPLLEAWQDGQQRAAELEDMNECPHCNNGTGDPCPSHG